MIFYMKTIKLKKTKKTKKNKTSRRKMKGAGKRPREETPIKSFLKRIFRSSSSITIRDITLGRGEPTSPVYGNQDLSEDQIKEFVEKKIQIGYQKVNIPMPPDEGHNIMVELTSSGNVKILEWNNETDVLKHRTKPGDKRKWNNYMTLIKILTEKYGKVIFYEVDKEIDQHAQCRHDTNNGQGGCSEYVDLWIKKHIGNYLSHHI